jgi:hypothetical protein
VKTTTALTTLHKLADSYHLQMQITLRTEGIKYYSQASYLVKPHQSSNLYANTRIICLRNNSRTFTKKLNFLLSLFLFVVFVFFCVWIFFSVLLTSPTLFSYSYSYPLTFPLVPALQSIVLSPNYSFCPFSPTLSLSSPPSPTPCNLLPHDPSLLHIHHLLTSLLYHLYTTPAPCNPSQKHPPLQQQKYTQTHTRTTKPSSSHASFSIHTLFFPPTPF